jgi:DNA-binding response OmpR family regulator
MGIKDSASTHPLQEFAPLRILVIEDDPLVSGLVVEHYQALGFDVDTAQNGAAALERMERQLPDLVLCDRKMPVMSGAELLEIIRLRGPEWQQMVFVFVTALDDRRDRYAMLPLRPDAYICKPIDFAREDAMLAALLGKKRPAGRMAGG